MAEAVATYSTAEKRYAVVTGANKGIGFEICRQLASHGITVVLTSRDEKRGLDALEKLKRSPFSDNVLFHQLDVTNSSSVATLADFVKIHFGRLDILVNNAAIIGVHTIDPDGLRAAAGGAQVNWKDTVSQNYDLAVECLQINYYGAKKMIEAFVPLLQLSKSPRIAMFPPPWGGYRCVPKLSLELVLAWSIPYAEGELHTVMRIPSEQIRGILDDENKLTDEKVDELLNEFLKDFKEASLETKGWPSYYSAYIVSKVTMNAYTRIVAKKYPDFKINSVCPGHVKTDINHNSGYLTVEEGAASPVRLALLPDDGPSGMFFVRHEVSSY